MRILGLDLGEKRIGVALSDSAGWLATPLTALQHRSREADLVAIEELVQHHGVQRIVVGFPVSLDGVAGSQAKQVERFATLMREQLPVPVVLWDERLSTAHAERLIHESGQRVRRDRIDAAAAAVILQSYLDAHSPLDNQLHPTSPSTATEED